MSKNKDSGVNEAVYDYLQKQNRPYSGVDVFNNLHKEHGKTAITRALEQLYHEKRIIEKTYGKQKIYFFDQNALPQASDDELAKMDAEVLNLDQSIKSLEQNLKTLDCELNKLTQSLTTPDIKNKIAQLLEENGELEARLETLTKNKDSINPKERDELIKNNEKYVKEWRKRKRIVTDMTDAILEGYPKPKKTLFEEMGLETDEDLKVSLPK